MTQKSFYMLWKQPKINFQGSICGPTFKKQNHLTRFSSIRFHLSNELTSAQQTKTRIFTFLEIYNNFSFLRLRLRICRETGFFFQKQESTRLRVFHQFQSSKNICFSKSTSTTCFLQNFIEYVEPFRSVFFYLLHQIAVMNIWGILDCLNLFI